MSYSRFKLYFGDPHIHTNISRCGVCVGRDILKRDTYVHTLIMNEYKDKANKISKEESIDLAYDFAKNKAKLDFAIITDHDYDLSDKLWKYVCKKANEWYSPGSFVTLPAYEWTSYIYGHRNVYFLNDEPPIFRCIDYGKGPWEEAGYTPNDLWEFLKKRGVKAITIPHHPSITQFYVDWNYYNPEFDRLVEIASLWGIFEYYDNPFACVLSNNLPWHFVVDALERGYIMGFVGGSDSHDCRPGDSFRPLHPVIFPRKYEHISSLTKFFVTHSIYNPLGCPLTAVYAKKLTREDLFDAFIRRRTYTVIGDRIRLEFSIDGHLMGESIIVTSNYTPELRVYAEANQNISEVVIIKNGKTFYRKFCRNKSISLKLIDNEEPSRKLNYYYVRVICEKGARAWSSPIWVIYEGIDKLKVSIERKGMLNLTNNTKFTFHNVRIGYLKEIRSYASSRKDRGEGAFFWVEKVDDFKYVLKVRLRSKSKVNYRGCLKLIGFESYYIMPINFSRSNYFGDVFIDDYRGNIEWDITVSSRVNKLDVHDEKGLDIFINTKATEKCEVIVEELVQNGERKLEKTFLNWKSVNNIPFTVKIYEPVLLNAEVIKVLKPFEGVFIDKVPSNAKYVVLEYCGGKRLLRIS